MSQQDSSAQRGRVIIPLLVTFGISLVNLSLITAGGICAAHPKIEQPIVWVATATAAVIALSILNWLVLKHGSLAVRLSQVIKSTGGAFVPFLFVGPLFPGGAWNALQLVTSVLLLAAMFAATLAPVALALGIFISRVAGTSRAAVYRPIAAAELPAPVRDYFAQRTWELERMGFGVLGDYRVKEDMEQFARLFARDDGEVAAAVEYARAGFIARIKSTSFLSVLGSGCYIETGNVALPRRALNVHEPMILQSLPKACDAERLEKHEALVVAAALAHSSAPRAVAPEELPALCRYGMKLLYDRLVREGTVTRNPYDHRDASLFCPSPEAELLLAR